MQIFKRKQTLFLLLAGTILLIILGLYLSSNKEILPVVLDTSPSNNSVEILETAQIDIKFTENIQEKTKNNISVTIKPDTQFDSTWLVNTYKVIPKTILQNNTKYTVDILFKDKIINSFSFDTVTFKQEEVDKFGGLQAQNDLKFGETLKTFVDKNTWFTLLPIRTKDYTIYYDSTQKKFSIAFISTELDQTQKNDFVTKALSDLRKIGVKDPISYYIFQP